MDDLPDQDGGDQPALDWREGGIPVSVRFDDPYFSLAGGLAETGHVFLAGNDLPARLRPGFHVAELGFGTGLN
ncbi:MAG: FAD-dependent oxidoreductase, partial [Paracoccus sp. (in: a-proteobacteria)]